MAHLLEDMTVLDVDGREVPLGQLWADRPAALVFVRHFGCVFCRQQMAEIGPLRSRVESIGGELAIIGHGSVAEARAFRDEQPTAIPVFTDPARKSYCALGMRRGPLSVFTPRVLTRSITAWRQGFRQSRVAGDPFQQGGVVVIAPTGKEHYRFISRDAGDHAPVADIFAAVERAVQEGPRNAAAAGGAKPRPAAG